MSLKTASMSMGHSPSVDDDVTADLLGCLLLLFSTSLRRNSVSLSLACNKGKFFQNSKIQGENSGHKISFINMKV